MKFTKDSTVNSLAKVKGIQEAIAEITGTKITPGMIAMGGGMTCTTAGSFVGWTDEQIEQIIAYANSVEETEE